MSESLRDRVARVLAEADGHDWAKVHRWALYRTETLRRADALIAAGLVYAPLRDSEAVERIGDRVGPNDPGLANRLWACAGALRLREAPREAL